MQCTLGATARRGRLDQTIDIEAHRRELRLRGRCPFCAEELPKLTLLRTQPCPSCGAMPPASPVQASEQLIEDLHESWGNWRYIAYPTLAVASGMAGLVPMLASVVRLVGLTIVHVMFVRRPLRWLSIRRRVPSKLTLRTYLAALVVLGLVIDAVVAPFFGANAAVSGATSICITLFYAEGSLKFITSRMRREATGSGLDWWEWALPAGLLGVLIVITLLCVALFLMFWNAIDLLPSPADITEWLMGSSQGEG